MAKELTDYSAQKSYFVVARMGKHPSLGAKCWYFWNPKTSAWKDEIELDFLFESEEAATAASRGLDGVEVYRVTLKTRGRN